LPNKNKSAEEENQGQDRNTRLQKYVTQNKGRTREENEEDFQIERRKAAVLTKTPAVRATNTFPAHNINLLVYYLDETIFWEVFTEL
jgi:hypothetical protein